MKTKISNKVDDKEIELWRRGIGDSRRHGTRSTT